MHIQKILISLAGIKSPNPVIGGHDLEFELLCPAWWDASGLSDDLALPEAAEAKKGGLVGRGRTALKWKMLYEK